MEMRPDGKYSQARLVEYDALHRRLWIFGQRCHHGATGSVVAGAAFFGLIAGPIPAAHPPARTGSIVALAAGGALMIHDWKDRSMWFQRGYGSQP